MSREQHSPDNTWFIVYNYGYPSNWGSSREYTSWDVWMADQWIASFFTRKDARKYINQYKPCWKHTTDGVIPGDCGDNLELAHACRGTQPYPFP